MADFQITEESITILVTMILASAFIIFIIFNVGVSRKEEIKTGILLEKEVDFYKFLTAPCLSTDNIKRSNTFVYDKKKLDNLKGNTIPKNCLDFGEDRYYILIEYLHDDSQKWEFGDPGIKFTDNQSINILDKDDMYIGFVKFGICKEDCDEV